MDKNATFASPATARASSVLPVPGGPTSSTPFGIFAPSCLKRSGSRRNSTISESSSFSSSAPATSWKVTDSPDGTPKRALARVNCAMAFGPLPERFIRMNHTNRSAMPTSRYGSAVFQMELAAGR